MVVHLIYWVCEKFGYVLHQKVQLFQYINVYFFFFFLGLYQRVDLLFQL